MEDSTTEMIRARVDKKIDRFVEGGLKHATKIISALWEIANKEEDVIASSNITPVVSSFRFYPLVYDSNIPCMARAHGPRVQHARLPWIRRSSSRSAKVSSLTGNIGLGMPRLGRC